MAPPPTQDVKGLQTIGHYVLLRPLGKGGMGEVYLAQDTKLDRRVAIKLLPKSSLDDEQARKRFVREARAVAQLDHPNICAVHEIGDVDGKAFIVMQYVEGNTLAATIRHQPLAIGEALAIAMQIAQALAEAHAHAIIHRDIKPQNVIVNSRRQVKVLDFGLAKVVRQELAVESDAETASLLSRPGLVIGTVPYMSPEQVRGEALDTRSDIFSFGALLYEIVSGQRAFASANSADIISAILKTNPSPLTRYVSDVPDELQRIVGKCLEKDRNRRYQMMREVATDLENLRRKYDTMDTAPPAARTTGENEAETETVFSPPRPTADNQEAVTGVEPPARSRFPSRLVWMAAALILVSTLALLGYGLWNRGAEAPATSPIRSIAVLPLENLSGDASQDYFADGMTEALINNLARIRAFEKVVSRNSVMRFKGSEKPLPEIARELGVEAIISGTVQRASGRVKVTAQLIRAATDTHLWARDYEREAADILKLQGEVARAVVDEIRLQVTSEERARLASARRIDPQAHEAYLLGRFHSRSLNEVDLSKAIAHYERAIQLAPDYAAAYVGLSKAWHARGYFGKKNYKEVEAPARAAALKALEFDADNVEARIALAHIKFIFDWNWTEAEAEYKRALELDPGITEAHWYYAHLLMALERYSEALTEIARAQQLDPLLSSLQNTWGQILHRARKYEEAIVHLERAIELDPRDAVSYRSQGNVYTAMGKYEKALEMYEKSRTIQPDSVISWSGIAHVYALTGKRREALEILNRVKNSAFGKAMVYVALGDKDEAFRILEKAIEERDSLFTFIKTDPKFDNLHSDPRWKELMRRMNYPE